MGWEHAKVIGCHEIISIYSLANKEKICEGKIWEEVISTGKQKVFMGYRTSVSFAEKTFSSNGYHHSMVESLKDLAGILASNGYSIRVWGLSDSFYESGLSFNSGKGYSKDKKNKIIKIIEEIREEN